MKIAVVTVHDSANFGSFLQAYALNAFLKAEGHEVHFVKTRSEKYVKNLYYNLCPSKEWIKHPLRLLKKTIYGMKKYKLFSRELACFDEALSCENADITVLGSDEIWNVRTPVFNSPLFYGEGCEKIIAYAVSSGLAMPSDFEGKSHIQNLIKKISMPLVRDENTADCVEKITGIRPEIVCDPTFLAEKEIFKRKYKNIYLEKHPYILIYTYEPEPRVRKIFKDFAKKHNLKLVSAGFYYDWCDYNILCSPLELCGVMEKAQYVITTTFHGSIFSILNHKKFVSIPLSQKTEDILKRLGLENAAVSFAELSEELLRKKLLETEYNYAEVDEKIAKMREHSAKLLRERIDQIK